MIPEPLLIVLMVVSGAVGVGCIALAIYLRFWLGFGKRRI